MLTIIVLTIVTLIFLAFWVVLFILLNAAYIGEDGQAWLYDVASEEE